MLSLGHKIEGDIAEKMWWKLWKVPSRNLLVKGWIVSYTAKILGRKPFRILYLNINTEKCFFPDYFLQICKLTSTWCAPHHWGGGWMIYVQWGLPIRGGGDFGGVDVTPLHSMIPKWMNMGVWYWKKIVKYINFTFTSVTWLSLNPKLPLLFSIWNECLLKM